MRNAFINSVKYYQDWKIYTHVEQQHDEIHFRLLNEN